MATWARVVTVDSFTHVALKICMGHRVSTNVISVYHAVVMERYINAYNVMFNSHSDAD